MEHLLTIAIEAIIASAVGVGSYIGVQNGRFNAFKEQLNNLELRVNEIWTIVDGLATTKHKQN